MMWLPGVYLSMTSSWHGKGSTEWSITPIDLRISNFIVTDPAGRRLLTAPDAHLTLSLAGLILGRIIPRTLEVDRGEFAMTREISGSVTLGFGQDGDSSPDPEPLDLRQLRDEFVHPTSSDHGPSETDGIRSNARISAIPR